MIEPKLRFKADDESQFPDWEEKKFANLYRKNVEKNVNLGLRHPTCHLTV